MTPSRWTGKRSRCVNCRPFADTPSTHVVKLPPARWSSWDPSSAHAEQIVRFHLSVGVPARAYRYRRIRGTQPRPIPKVLISGY
jgi:hypothetical protein